VAQSRYLLNVDEDEVPYLGTFMKFLGTGPPFLLEAIRASAQLSARAASSLSLWR